MTNREFYKDKVIDIALSGHQMGVVKKTLEPCACRDLLCCNCVGCSKLKEWANAEYIEHCPFEKNEIVEVSNDRVDWKLRYFNCIDNGKYMTFANGLTSNETALLSSWSYCRKYGTLSGLVKEE